MMARRAFLRASTIAVATAVAGCASGEDGGEPFVNETGTVDPGSSLTYRFNLDSVVDLSVDVTVQSGPRLDAYFLRQSELSHYETGEEFDYNVNLSEEGTDGYSATLDGVAEGRYALVVDNTEHGEATPPADGTAEVAVEIRSE